MLTSILAKLKELCVIVRQMVTSSRFTTDEVEGKIMNTIQMETYGTTTRSYVYYPMGYMAGTPKEGMGISFNLSGSRDNQVTLPYEFDTKFRGLKPYEVQLGNQKKQTYVKFNDDGSILIHSDTETTINVNLTVTGNAEIKKNLTVDENAEVKMNLTVDQNATIKQNATVNQNTTIGGNLSIAGTISAPSGTVTGSGTFTTTGSFEAGASIKDGSASTPTMQDIRDLFNSHTHPDPQGGNTSPPNQQM